jgi:glucosamine--fructose-6-phosphate aminotransferase (isomerizing)
MCGIIGFLGTGDGIENVLDGLTSLEYRGYDSAGVAYLSTNNTPVLKTIRAVGHMESLIKAVSLASPPKNVQIAIGHTRWATHGAVTENNAHPHTSKSGNIAVVHNGIIENYREIIDFLRGRGFEMRTQTDTEVIPNLIEYYYHGDLRAATHSAISHLQGSYAFVVLATSEPDTLICAKHGMPMCVSRASDFVFITSDIQTAMTKTDTIFVMNNDELAVVNRNRFTFFRGGEPITKQPIKIDDKREVITKGTFPTYMEKEIHDIPELFERLITHYNEKPFTPELLNMLQSARTVHICACGTAFHAGLVLGSLLERNCHIRVKTHIASEFRYQNPLIFDDDIGIVISQSGETADTIAAMHLLQENHIPVAALCNTENSTIAREADFYLPTLAGFEIAVASTKAYCAQVLLAAILMDKLYALKNNKHYYDDRDFKMLPMFARLAIDKNDEIKDIAQSNLDVARIFFLGKGLDAHAACEAALKVKEITYMQCEGYPAGELKHGTLSLVDDETLTVVFQTQSHLIAKTQNAAAEVTARGSMLWNITPIDQISKVEFGGKWSITLPPSPLIFTYSLIPIQLFALHLAVMKGLNPDKPRNLAKSVTVE